MNLGIGGEVWAGQKSESHQFVDLASRRSPGESKVEKSIRTEPWNTATFKD